MCLYAYDIINSITKEVNTLKLIEGIIESEALRLLVKKIALAVFVLFMGTVIVNLIIKWLKKILYIGPHNQKKRTLFTVLSSLVKYVIYFLTFMTILEIFGISTRSIVAVASVGSVALGFGAQALVKDIISGLFILTENQFNVEDLIEIADYTGTVEVMSLRTTTLRTAKGEQCIIPNGEIRGVKNYSRDYMNAIIDLPVPYDVDLDLLLDDIQKHLDAFELEDHILEKPKVHGVSEFGDSALMIRITCKCMSGKNWAVERALRKSLLDLLNALNIEVPYNTSTVHLKND